MLDAQVKKQLETYMDKLVDDIDITVVADDSELAQKMRSLAQDIASLSNKVRVLVGSEGDRKPTLGLSQRGSDSRIKFAGLPMGHEFNSLVLALLHTGGHAVKATDEQLTQIAELHQPMHFETYVSLSCQNCPDVVQALNLLATCNPNIQHTMIDGAHFQAEVDERHIMAVPSVFLNGELFSSGRMTLTDILNKLDQGSSQKQAEKIDNKKPFDTLIIGGGPAGAAAAIYTARKGIRTGIVADRFGGQVQDTLAIENFISVPSTEGPKLAASLEQHVLSYDVDVMNNQKAVDLDVGEQITVTLESGATVQARSVILSTGAKWREMNVPGEQQYRGKGVAYCPHCDGPLFKGKPVAVIGGGNSGVEAAIDLAAITQHVTVLEFADTLRADDVLLRKAASLPNITMITEALTTEVVGDGQKVTGLNYQDRKTGDAQKLELAGIFVQIGLVPNTDWLQGKVDLNARGEIIVDARGQTSSKGVFAAGDVTDSAYKQIIIAMGHGATAALSSFDYLIRQESGAQQAAA